MSSVAAPEIVRPSYLWVPEHVSSAGAEAVELAALVGLTLDPEQELALDAMLAEDADGNFVSLEFALICARQNLKTVTFEAAALHDLFVCEDELVIWTAHLFDTAQEAFRDMDNLIGSSDQFVRRVLRINRANGDEGFELKNGSRLKFKARSKSGGRGLSGDKVYLDEAFKLTPSEIGALMPTMAARPNPQVRAGSSAGLPESAVLRGLRDRGRPGGDPSLTYVEWAAPTDTCQDEQCSHEMSVKGCALDDPEQWRKANPQMDRSHGHGISREYIAAERRALSTEPEEFARERLGWWSHPGSAEMPYPVKDWLALADLGSKRVGPPSFAIDTNPIRSRSAIAYCGARIDELAHVEVSNYEPGTGWVVERAKAIKLKFGEPKFAVADPGAAASLIPDLEKAGIEVIPYNSRDLVAACGALADAIRDKTVHHIGQEELNDAVLMARKRELEGAWALARKGGDIAPLVAAVLAHHLWLTEKSEDYDLMDSFL